MLIWFCAPINEFPQGDEAVVPVHNEVAGVFQEPIFRIRQVPANLLHPHGIRNQRNASNVDAVRFQVHDEENVEHH